MPTNNHFSHQLEGWLASAKPKTVAGLVEAFAEKSFAVVFLLLMLVPALPVPTGGLTHAFEIVVMLAALELVAGLKSVWLPRRWQRMKLSQGMQQKTVPAAIRIIKWFERFSRPRLTGLLRHPMFLVVVGLVVLVLTLGAFLAPPFSGLDTLPSLGVVLVSLALILEDAVILALGLVVGLAGIFLTVGLGSVIYRLILGG